MNRAELQFKIEILQRELERLTSIKPSCQQCKHFDHLGQCEIAGNQLVPTEVISTGCDEWQDDLIPF